MGTSARFFWRIYSLVTPALLFVALFFLVAAWVISVLLRESNHGQDALEFFSRVLGVVFRGWTTDHRPQLWVAHPRLHRRPRRFLFLSGVRLLSSKIILYLILPSEFQLSYRCYCSLYSTFLFETLWLDFFVCVCVCYVLGVALFWLSSFFC